MIVLMPGFKSVWQLKHRSGYSSIKEISEFTNLKEQHVKTILQTLNKLDLIEIPRRDGSNIPKRVRLWSWYLIVPFIIEVETGRGTFIQPREEVPCNEFQSTNNKEFVGIVYGHHLQIISGDYMTQMSIKI